jgi:outer membrane lipoprotein-sorting protein
MFTAIGLLICLSANAQLMSDSDSQIADKIKKDNQPYTTLTGKFKQTRHISILGEKIISSGMLYYSKPDRLAIQYDAPAGDMMLIDGDKFVMINSGRRSETTSKSNAKMRGMKAILSACLRGDVREMGAEKISCSETQQYYNVSADIDRKTNKSNISRVVLSYDKKDMTLTMLQTVEPDGSYSIYELTDKKIDQAIDENIFRQKQK